MWKPEYEANRKQRIAADPEYAARIKNRPPSRTPEENRIYMSAYYRANKDKYVKNTPELREQRNALRRERYRTDAKFREGHKAKVKEWQSRQGVRLSQRMRKYGITAADYARMLDAQGGGCAICGATESRVRTQHGETQRLHVDHCHATGRVRGLLCAACNLSLGKFNDDPNRFEQAALYLRRHIGAEGADQ